MSVEEHVPSVPGGWGALSDLPGHPMMWVLILCEMVTFGLLLLAFVVARLVQPEVFAAGQAILDQHIGGANTLVLVTSGWLAALAVDRREAGWRDRAQLRLAGAMALGFVFIGLKLVEYRAKAEAGIGLETDTFFTLYFLITGFHLLHVVMGLAVLGAVACHDSVENLRTGAAFWHMVDLVWVVMYAIIYLVR
jgi:nitric oxide reductase NorE protein